MSRDLPILFAGPLVRAILDGTKTQTRRPVNWRGLGMHSEPPDVIRPRDDDWIAEWLTPHGWRGGHVQPAYRVGDRLYVRETYARDLGTAGGFLYRADHGEAAALARRWTPSIHMPKSAARIWLCVEGVRVERVRDITDADARAEGVTLHGYEYLGLTPHQAEFRRLWVELYGRAAWDDWCWVYDLSRIEVPR